MGKNSSIEGSDGDSLTEKIPEAKTLEAAVTNPVMDQEIRIQKNLTP